MMRLRDLFNPQWKNSNPRVRLDAIKMLDDAEILQKIVEQDEDQRVREAALDKISDEKIYVQLAQKVKVSDPLTFQLIQKRLSKKHFDLLVNETEWRIELEESLRSLANSDQELLGRVVFEAKTHEVRREAIVHLQAEKVLFQLAMNMGQNSSEFAGLIMDKISDVHYLRRLARESQVKRVKKRAEEKLRELEGEEGLGGLTKTEALDRMVKELREMAARGQWQEEQKRFQEICAQFDQHFSGTEARMPMLKVFIRLREELEDHFNAYFYSISKINNIIEQIKNAENESALKALEEEFRRIGKSRLSELEKRESDEKLERAVKKSQLRLLEQAEAQGREAQAASLVKRTLREVRELNDNFWQLVKRSEEDLIEKKERLVQEFKGNAHAVWNNFREQAELFEQEMKAIEEKLISYRCKQASTEELTTFLRGLCEKMETANKLENGRERQQQMMDAIKEWKKVGDSDPVVKQLKKELNERFQKECDDFYRWQNEFRQNQDWQKWMNLKQKQELLKKAEELLGREKIGQLAQEILALKDQWKGTGQTPTKAEGDELWNRFYEVCTKAYERALSHKKEIYQKAEELLTPVLETGADLKQFEKLNLKEVAAKVKELQAAWNEIGVLPKKMEGDLYENFRKKIDNFFDKRKALFEIQNQDRQVNLQEKRSLLNEALKIQSASNIDNGEKAKKLRDLQKRWREVGPLPHGEGEDLWDQFHHICNEFFAGLDKEKNENLLKKEALIMELEAFLAELGDGAEANLNEVQEKWQEFKERFDEIGQVPPEKSEDIWSRFHRPMENFTKMKKQQIAEESIEQDKLWQKKIDLIGEMEELTITLPETAVAEVRIQQIKEKWDALGTLAVAREENELKARLEELVTFYDLEKNNYERLSESEREQNLRKQEEALKHLAVIAQVFSPEAFSQISREFPVINMAEHLDLALKYKNKILTGDAGEEAKKAKREAAVWCKQFSISAAIPQEHKRRLTDQFKSLQNIIR